MFKELTYFLQKLLQFVWFVTTVITRHLYDVDVNVMYLMLFQSSIVAPLRFKSSQVK